MHYTSLRSELYRAIGGVSIIAIALAAVAAALFAAVPPQAAYADNITPPPVPANLQVPAGNKVYKVGHASGTQNYICLPSGTGYQWVLFTPEATLYNGAGRQIITHFFSPNPAEANTNPRVVSDHQVRAAWQSSKDASTVWALAQPGHSSTDPAFVEPGAVAWLLLTVVGTQDGTDGRGELSQTTFIQRLNTHGGVAPSTGCASAEDVGRQAFVPYTTDYYFYKSAAN